MTNFIMQPTPSPWDVLSDLHPWELSKSLPTVVY